METIVYEAIPSDLDGTLLDIHAYPNSESKPQSFESDCWVSAISLVNKLGINCNLTLALRAEQISNAHTAIGLMIDAANEIGISTNRIILNVYQDSLMSEVDVFAYMILLFRNAV